MLLKMQLDLEVEVEVAAVAVKVVVADLLNPATMKNHHPATILKGPDSMKDPNTHHRNSC